MIVNRYEYGEAHGAVEEVTERQVQHQDGCAVPQVGEHRCISEQNYHLTSTVLCFSLPTSALHEQLTRW